MKYGPFRLNKFIIANQWLYSQHFIFFVTYEFAKKLVLDCTRLERLSRDKHSSVMGAFVSYKKMKCGEFDPWRAVFASFNRRIFFGQA